MKKEDNDDRRFAIILCFFIPINIGVFIYNFQYLLTIKSFLALIVSFVLVIRAVLSSGDYDSILDFFKDILYLLFKKNVIGFITMSLCMFLFILIPWQILLFFIILCEHYLIPIALSFISKLLIPLIKSHSYNILKELGIDDTSGLFGALIGGMFSILAVKITIDSSSKQSFKKNLDFASPKIVITTLLENVDSVIGKTAFMREDYDNDRIIYFTDPETDGANEMFTFYVTNIGGEALNITLSIHFTWRNLLSDYIFWFAMENNDIKILDEFPMLKKGNALEIKISKEHISEKLEFIVSYNDVFSNRYIQYHDVRVGSSMEVELLPKQIKRKRKKKYYWRTTKLSSFFNEDITEEAGRNR